MMRKGLVVKGPLWQRALKTSVKYVCYLKRYLYLCVWYWGLNIGPHAC
jgi:hypothetical protein